MAVSTETLIDLIEVLPDEDKQALFSIVKKLVLAWDPDFTKLTPKERASLENALSEPNEDRVSLDDYLAGIDPA